MENISYKIEGMTCASCAISIEKETKKMDGVKSSNVNYASESALFEITDPTKEEALKSIIHELGYKIKEVTSVPQKNQRDKNLFQFIFSFTLSLVLFFLAMGPGKSYFNQNTNFLIQFFLALPIIMIPGRPFLKAVLLFIRKGHSSMNTLIGIGISSAFIYSAFITFFPHLSKEYGLSLLVYYEAIGFITSFVLLGKYFENKSKMKAKESLNELLKIQSQKANVIRDDKEILLDIKDIQKGDKVRVKPGEKIPVDGLILKGLSQVDESMITGESLPLLKEKGHKVFAGTINLDGTFDLKAKAIGEQTFLNQIVLYIEKALMNKPKIQALADRVSSIFVPIIIGLALLTFLSWFFLGPEPRWGNAISYMITVLVIACPCALGLATPTAVVVTAGRALKKGFLISGGEVIEKGYELTHVIFDKTGTLTEAKPQVDDVFWVDSLPNQNELLDEIISLEHYSEHPLSKAIQEFKQDISLKDPSTFEAISGLGIKGSFGDNHYHLGSRRFLESEHLDFEDLDKTLDQSKLVGSHVYIGLGKKVIGLFILNDTLKPEAKKVIQSLKDKGLTPMLLTGDNALIAQKVSKELQLDHFKAQLMPLDKAKFIKKLQADGHKVAMIGDGINDAPALIQADLSMAMGTGTDLAKNSADITIINGDISKTIEFFQLSTKAMTIIKQNLFLSFAYNLFFIPLAAGIFVPHFGWSFSPIFASMAMGLSSISVVTNSLRIK